jgi:hypothetical protein
MQQVQFFLFGLLIVWLVGTGKLKAFFAALATTPATTPPVSGVVGPGTRYPWDPPDPNAPSPGNAIR